MKSFLVGINLNRNELQNAVIHNVTSRPATASKGQLVFDTNTGENNLYVYNGSSWVTWAPVNHASTASTYGGAGVDTFGHVKLVDELSDQQASTATALSPYAVKHLLVSSIVAGEGGTSPNTIPTTGALVTFASEYASQVIYPEVDSKIAAIDSMRFLGTIGTGSDGDIHALPTSGVKRGDTYRCVTSFTLSADEAYSGTEKECEVGDLIIAVVGNGTNTDPKWTVAQTNIDGAITNVVAGTALGSTASDNGHTITLNHAQILTTNTRYGASTFISSADVTSSIASAALKPTFGDYIELADFTANQQGHVFKGNQVYLRFPRTMATSTQAGLLSPLMYQSLNTVANNGLIYQSTYIGDGAAVAVVPYSRVIAYKAMQGNSEVVIDCNLNAQFSTVFSVATPISGLVNMVNIFYAIPASELSASSSSGGGLQES